MPKTGLGDVRCDYKPVITSGMSSTPLAARLRELRVDAGWTQHDAAVQYETWANRISTMETGKHTPTLQTLARIAHVHGMTAAQLLDGIM